MHVSDRLDSASLTLIMSLALALTLAPSLTIIMPFHSTTGIAKILVHRGHGEEVLIDLHNRYNTYR